MNSCWFCEQKTDIVHFRLGKCRHRNVHTMWTEIGTIQTLDAAWPMVGSRDDPHARWSHHGLRSRVHEHPLVINPYLLI